uniref:Cytochrome b561 domain-containing protein n=1 Tax=Ciona savignyi TaxID=51511 RepID=H2Y926_CIOSA
MSSLNELEDMEKLRGLSWMVALSQGLGITMVILMGVWLNTYMGGFAWDGSGKEFNLHPLCMICGMVFLYGEAALVYRVFRQTEKLKAKIIHASLLLLAFIAIVVGLVAVFQFHHKMHITNMYSLHSWFGMITVLLFCLQFLLGFLSFLLPGARPSIRSFYLPLHQFFGGGILTLAVISVISGINEKLFFKYKGTGYSKLPASAVIANVCGLVTIGFVLTILYIIQKKEWQRKPASAEEEESLAIHFQPISGHGTDTE